MSYSYFAQIAVNFKLWTFDIFHNISCNFLNISVKAEFMQNGGNLYSNISQKFIAINHFHRNACRQITQDSLWDNLYYLSNHIKLYFPEILITEWQLSLLSKFNFDFRNMHISGMEELKRVVEKRNGLVWFRGYKFLFCFLMFLMKFFFVTNKQYEHFLDLTSNNTLWSPYEIKFLTEFGCSLKYEYPQLADILILLPYNYLLLQNSIFKIRIDKR